MRPATHYAVQLAAPHDFEELARLRYEALTDDPGFRPTPQMRDGQTLTDEWDSISDVFVARNGAEIVGTFRVLRLARFVERYDLNAAFEAFGQLGLVQALEAFPIASINILGRLAVASSARGTPAVLDLLSVSLFEALGRGERLALADCSPPLVSLYARLAGYFRSALDFHHPIYGTKAPIMGALADHQASSGTPLAHVVSQFPDDGPAREFRLRCVGSVSCRAR
jgi:hypothetical protein